ncbi:MAG: putative DNA binding domain-containing protein [Myxococcales bacterium]|nr:putative DNA binding domain-containing protein [Myxococcales bacterium]
MAIIFSSDRVRGEVARVLEMLQAGEPVAEDVETQILDLKEEHGRRDKTGAVGPGLPQNEVAARGLAEAAACMANTPGGGALLVGVTKTGELIGTALDAEWLRRRIYELTEGKLTVDVQPTTVAATRLLVIVAPTALEPIRWRGKIRWRVGASCEEIDASTWHARQLSHAQYDWSLQESAVGLESLRPAAVAQARDFLLASDEPLAAELATAPDAQLLRRLGAMTGGDKLTHAGALAFVGREQPCLDYVRRDHAGGDSTQRVRRIGRSLLEELAEVFTHVDANNAIRHLPQGLVAGRVRQIPALAAREAIVNGVAHRDWNSPEPTLVEHVGQTLRVTSPGGFCGGVTPANIITHPSKSRNRALTQLLADLRIAEREGIGVDRMVAEMIRVGHGPPEIQEIDGPSVRVSLVGDDLDEAWMAWLAELEPREESRDLNSLLLLRHLVRHGWLDVICASPLLQLSVGEARGAIVKLGRAQLAGAPVLERVRGVPAEAEPAWVLTAHAVARLHTSDSRQGRRARLPNREELALSYARARGRVSTTELGSMVHASSTNVGGVLKRLEAQGHLRPSRRSRRGPGFYYVYVSTASEAADTGRDG